MLNGRLEVLKVHCLIYLSQLRGFLRSLHMISFTIKQLVRALIKN